MKKTVKVKTFLNGGSQAVRIPADCRFDEPEIYLTFDTETGVVTLNKSGPATLDELLESFRADPLPVGNFPDNFFKTLWPKDDFRDRIADFDEKHK